MEPDNEGAFAEGYRKPKPALRGGLCPRRELHPKRWHPHHHRPHHSHRHQEKPRQVAHQCGAGVQHAPQNRYGFFEPYTGAVSIDDAGAFRVGVRVPDPKSSSDDYSVIRDENFTIKLAPTYTKYTLTVVNGRAYQANGSEFSTNSTGSSRTYNINGNVLVEIRANQPASGKVFEKWTGSNVGVADPYSPTTTLTMPTHNATVTAEISGAPLITGETRLKMTPESGPVEALSFFHKNFGSRRMLTYDWYEGSEKLGTRTEIKNMNSFKNLHDGLAYEICRQAEVLEEGGQIYQETRHWDPTMKHTIVMRVKETADDYRLFPEPDLAPYDLSDEFIPGFVERCEVFAAFVRERVVLAGRTLRGFLPAVGQQSGIFLPGEDRVERTLDYDHLGLLEFGDDLRSIRVLAGENGEDAVLQNSFAHLRLYVVFSHGAMRLTFWGLWERSARG